MLCLFVGSLVSESPDVCSCNVTVDDSHQTLKFWNFPKLNQIECLLLSVHKVSICALTSVIPATLEIISLVFQTRYALQGFYFKYKTEKGFFVALFFRPLNC